MKLKVRLIIFACAAFMLFVSFKILEPEIRRRQGTGDNSQIYEGGVPLGAVIKNQVEEFKVDWKHSLGGQSPWTIAAKWIENRHIHPEKTPELGAILRELATRPIIAADVGFKGTQLKLSLTLKGGQTVAFKPEWYARNDIINGTPYAGRDRHNAEIAAFHLGRLLHFRRTPLAVGRRVNLQTEIMPVATPELLATFFTKGDNNCFYGKCMFCKGPDDGVCAKGQILEGTIILWLPSEWTLKTVRHPWSRTYSTKRIAKWETDSDYCSKVLMVKTYSSGSLLLDLIDTAIFDYLIGNADRHHYEHFSHSKENMVLILDNAKSFGDPDMDERSILAPLYQCCRFRFSTWQRLLALQDGVLSGVMKEILAQDPIAPILTEEHLKAMDRRLLNILLEMEKCVAENGMTGIVMDHSYH
ncbi:glycosaminoglycan xylosylkinase-like [Haliotis cracherodii]|uniref:glycosaminoglycan xylosylkinase-like n=1 Tax=Haliotis cracherodii TaxID=6455 RepID=UPI0039E850F6